MIKVLYSNKQCDVVLKTSEYKGHKYAIRTLGYYPTAYVSLDKDIEDEFLLDSVYGGITFHSVVSGHLGFLDKNLVYIGWDYGHAMDYLPFNEKGIKHTFEEVEGDCKKVIDEIIEKGL